MRWLEFNVALKVDILIVKTKKSRHCDAKNNRKSTFRSKNQKRRRYFDRIVKISEVIEILYSDKITKK